MSEHDWVNRTLIQIVLTWLALLTSAIYLGFLYMTKSRDELDAALTDVETKVTAETAADEALRNAVAALLAKLPASADYQAEVDRLTALGVTADAETAADTTAAANVTAAE